MAEPRYLTPSDRQRRAAILRKSKDTIEHLITTRRVTKELAASPQFQEIVEIATERAYV